MELSLMNTIPHSYSIERQLEDARYVSVAGNAPAPHRWLAQRHILNYECFGRGAQVFNARVCARKIPDVVLFRLLMQVFVA